MGILWKRGDNAPKQFDWAFLSVDESTNEVHIRIAGKSVVTSPLKEPRQPEPIKYGLDYICFRTMNRWYYAVDSLNGLRNALQYMEAEEPLYIPTEEE